MSHYEALNIPQDADTNTIKRAYFTMVKQYTPDSNPEMFKQIRAAYEILSDNKKRAAYDAFFSELPSKNNELRSAKELIYQKKYKQAVDLLISLNKSNPESYDIKRLLAEAYAAVGKRGLAENICKELIKNNPDDYDITILRGNIANNRGHVVKAEEHFERAVSLRPNDPKAWTEYVLYAINQNEYLFKNIFDRAYAIDPDMFRDKYKYYMLRASDTSKNKLLREILGLSYIDDNALSCLEKFVDYFAIDHDKETYKNAINFISHMIEYEEYFPCIKRLLDAIEKSKYLTKDDEERILDYRIGMSIRKMKDEPRIHQVFTDMSIDMVNERYDDMLQLEYYIVSRLPNIMECVKVIKEEYPLIFKLKESFYNDLLDERKHHIIMAQYERKTSRSKMFISYGEKDYGFEGNQHGTFVRETPKVGRNDPCPCGSGKKYKKCCG